MNKRILLIRSTPIDLDISRYNVQQVGLGRAFVDLGYDYDFITFKKDKRQCRSFVFYEKNGHRATCIEKPRLRLLRWGINTAIAKKDFLDQYDLVICQEYYQLESYIVARNTSKVALYSGPYYNMFLPKFLSPIYDCLIGPKLNKLVKTIFVKSVLAEDFLSYKGFNGLVNVGVALDTQRFEHVELKPETESLIDFMKQNRCILYVGALSDRKNFPFMLDLYATLLEKDPCLKFVVIGKSVSGFWHKLFGGKDKDYEEACMKNVSKKVLSGIKRVERVDNPQLKYIYPLCKAFLLPSKLEIFGMVLLEAMYLGAPVVTSRNGGSVTLIGSDDKYGQMVCDFDINLWSEAILKYCNDLNYTNGVVENCKQLIKNKYNWDVIARNMLNHLKSNGYGI